MDEICGYKIDYLKSIGVVGREFGDFMWDRWKKVAIEAGISQSLADQGCATIRERWGHMWEEFDDSELDLEYMIELAIEFPKYAQRRWAWLEISDGERALDHGANILSVDEIADNRLNKIPISQLRVIRDEVLNT